MNANPKSPIEYVLETARESQAIRDQFLIDCGETLVAAAREIGRSIARGGKVLIFGNGGSAADSQHMAAEMIGRMLIERRPLPAMALSTDTSNLTAVGNDYGYEFVFSKQVEALARPEDICVAISTSGNSKNVLLAVEKAKAKGCQIIGITGGSGGKLREMAHFSLNAALGKNSSRIQETHIFAAHSLVDLVDRYFLDKEL